VQPQNGAGEGKGMGNVSHGRLSQDHACASPSLLPGFALFFGEQHPPNSIRCEHHDPPQAHTGTSEALRRRKGAGPSPTVFKLTVVDPAAAAAAPVCPRVVLIYVGWCISARGLVYFSALDLAQQRSAFPLRLTDPLFGASMQAYSHPTHALNGCTIQSACEIPSAQLRGYISGKHSVAPTSTPSIP
jgi:hypothetical protein